MRLLFVALAMAASSAAAQTSLFDYYPDPRLPVNPISATQFEVIDARGAGAPDFWCAAARYADRTLGIRRGRLYVETPRGPAKTAPGEKGVVFTTVETPNANTSYTLSVRDPGRNLSISHALRFCNNYFPRSYR